MLVGEALPWNASGGELGSDPALETDLETVENGGGSCNSWERFTELVVDIIACSAIRIRL